MPLPRRSPKRSRRLRRFGPAGIIGNPAVASYLVPVLTTQNQVGHTLVDRGTGRQLCDLMEKMDRSAMLDAANALAPSPTFASWSNSRDCPRPAT